MAETTELLASALSGVSLMISLQAARFLAFAFVVVLTDGDF